MYPQQPQYPPTPMAPPMPQYPPGYGAPAQPMMPAYPQGYGYTQPQAPTAPPPPPGTLNEFYSQPSGGGGPSFKFMDASRQPQIGKSYVGIVARPITDSDIQTQTDHAGVPRTYKDGRLKRVMVVPMIVQPSPEFPDGTAGWWVKGQARDELARAMAEAGAPQGPPEPGAAIQVQLIGTRPVPNMNPQFLFRVVYQRPQGAAPVQQPAAPVEIAPAAQAPTQPAPNYPIQGTVPPAVQQPVPPAVQAPAAVQQLPAAPPPATVAPPQGSAAAGLDPDQQALLARLTGQPTA